MMIKTGPGQAPNFMYFFCYFLLFCKSLFIIIKFYSSTALKIEHADAILYVNRP